MGTLFDEAESAPTALTWRIWTRNVALTHSSFETAASDNPADRCAVGPGGVDRNAIERVVPQDEALGFAYAIALGPDERSQACDLAIDERLVWCIARTNSPARVPHFENTLSAVVSGTSTGCTRSRDRI